MHSTLKKGRVRRVEPYLTTDTRPIGNVTVPYGNSVPLRGSWRVSELFLLENVEVEGVESGKIGNRQRRCSRRDTFPPFVATQIWPRIRRVDAPSRRKTKYDTNLLGIRFRFPHIAVLFLSESLPLVFYTIVYSFET